MRAGRRLRGNAIHIRFSRIFKKESFFERPQAEFQIDAIAILYTNCLLKQSITMLILMVFCEETCNFLSMVGPNDFCFS
ncbi:MAG: hypothetical protein BGO44_06815 [Legionella sp. 39-23]|nr:MAG: hypothetical protein BGO44_06815 [Legionella sp. 39-23]